MMDDSFKDEHIEKYKMYAAAFYPGTVVDVIRQGKEIPNKTPKKVVEKNFLKGAKIKCRDRGDGWVQYSTHGKQGFLQTLPRYKPDNAYCVIGLTNEDIYPMESWNFCFGWATYNVGVGAFSFHRYDPAFDGIEDDNNE